MKNMYEIRGEITAIFIKSRKFGNVETIISTNKLPKALEYKGSWVVRADNCTGKPYVTGSLYEKLGTRDYKRTQIFLHRWITNTPKPMVVDHIDHNTLNNCDFNLRSISRGANSQNRVGPRKGSKSGVRGVTWHPRKNNWRVRIMKDYKMMHLGYFDTLEEAERVAMEARKQHMPYSQEALA